jgi:peptidoglycan hydrolase-like protein with peptidoglycan-binding domain
MHDAETLRSVQQTLAQRGFDPGPIDGLWGPRTEAALRSFQQSQGLSASGSLDAQTLAALNVSGGTATATSLPTTRSSEAGPSAGSDGRSSAQASSPAGGSAADTSTAPQGNAGTGSMGTGGASSSTGSGGGPSATGASSESSGSAGSSGASSGPAR